MTGFEEFGTSLWWIFPLIMIVLCFFMMRGGGCMGFGERHWRRRHEGPGQGGTATEILDRRYASGDISGSEYEEMKGRIEKG